MSHGAVQPRQLGLLAVVLQVDVHPLPRQASDAYGPVLPQSRTPALHRSVLQLPDPWSCLHRRFLYL